MKNSRGFIDPITLGFLISLVSTTTVLITHDDDQITNALNATTQIETQKITRVETDKS